MASGDGALSSGLPCARAAPASSTTPSRTATEKQLLRADMSVSSERIERAVVDAGAGASALPLPRRLARVRRRRGRRLLEREHAASVAVGGHLDLLVLVAGA